MLDSWREFVRSVVRRMPSRKGAGLIGFIAEFEHYVTRDEVFRVTEIRQGPDELEKIQAIVEPSSDLASLSEVSTAIQALWGRMHYSYFQASATIYHPTHTAFYFVTAPHTEHYCITGQLKVLCSNQETLVADLKNKTDFPSFPSFVIDEVD